MVFPFSTSLPSAENLNEMQRLMMLHESVSLLFVLSTKCKIVVVGKSNFFFFLKGKKNIDLFLCAQSFNTILF
jgi:hypothetical protein